MRGLRGQEPKLTFRNYMTLAVGDRKVIIFTSRTVTGNTSLIETATS